MTQPKNDMTENFFMVLDGVPCEISGRIVTQIGDPARQMTYVFIKSDDGGNYVKRRGTCSCCSEEQEDWFKFESYGELKEHTGNAWIFEAVANSMVGPPGGVH